MKIGILTYHRATNYGAFLQAYSLCKALNQVADIQAEVIDYSMQSAWDFYDVRAWSLKKKIRLFGHLHYRKEQNALFANAVDSSIDVFSRDKIVSDDIEELRTRIQSRYDVIVVGSDEVWKINCMRGYPNPYFLPGDFGCRKFSYAASFGKSINLTGDEEKRMQADLGGFEVLSVRDQIAYDYVRRNGIGESVMLSCDPSFLYDFKEEIKGAYNPLLDEMLKTDKHKKTIVVMVDEASAEIIRRQLKGKYNLISLYRKQKGYINVLNIDPFSWLKIIAEAEFVIASFFHCVCFSICNNTPFIAIGSKGKRHKIGDLLGETRLEKCYILSDQLEKVNLISKIEEISADISGFENFVSIKRSGFKEYVDLLRKDPSQK